MPTDIYNYGNLAKFLLVFIFSGFIPFSAMSFFFFVLGKKRTQYKNAVGQMGITNPTRKIEDTFSAENYFLPVTFAFLVCFLGVTYITFANYFTKNLTDSLLLTGIGYGVENKAMIHQSMGVLTMAFFGGFIWSAQNIVRRLINCDLRPSVYYSVGLRIILASLVALVLSMSLGTDGADILGIRNGLPAISFLAGMFPERLVSFFIRQYRQFFEGEGNLGKTLSLDNIEGISTQHRERLEEIGIDNAQNLANASLTQLLIDTPFESRLLLDWIGQAKLLTYVKEDMDKFRSIGIRTVFDLLKGQRAADRLPILAAQAGIRPALLDVLREQIIEDQGVAYLNEFQNNLNQTVSAVQHAPMPELKPIEETNYPEVQVVPTRHIPDDNDVPDTSPVVVMPTPKPSGKPKDDWEDINHDSMPSKFPPKRAEPVVEAEEETVSEEDRDKYDTPHDLNDQFRSILPDINITKPTRGLSDI
jgi:hypothetical protein